jgi:hypothetical protein
MMQDDAINDEGDYVGVSNDVSDYVDVSDNVNDG